MDVVFLVYGLAFLCLGLVIVIRNEPDSEMDVSGILWLLAAFAFIHGLYEWMHLWRVVRGDMPLLAATRPAVLLVSYLSLFEFGRRLVLASLSAAARAKPAAALLGAWVYAPMLLGVGAAAIAADQSGPALTIWARYLPGFLGASLAGAGCYLYCGARLRAVVDVADFPTVHVACNAAAAAFVAYGIFGGLVAPRAEWFPASALNEESFFAAFGVPVQLIRAACAVAITFSVGVLLRVFDIESRQKLRGARGTAQSAMAELISARQDGEAAIRRSERRMRALLDASPESTFLLDPRGTVLALNRIAARRFEKTPEDMIGRNLFDFMPADVAESRRATLHQVVASGKPARTTDRRGATDFEHNVFPVVNDAGTVEGVAVYARNITEQLRAQRLDAMFHRLDLLQLKSRLGLTGVAQTFCDELRPLFDLETVWIGRADEGGAFELMAICGRREDFLDAVRANCCRWDGGPRTCFPARAVLHDRQLHKVASCDPACGPCRDAAQAAGVAATLLLPLTLRGTTWGVLAFYASTQELFDQPDVPPRLESIANRLCVSLESALQQDWLTLLDTALSTTGSAVFITDTAGRILWANVSFYRLSGYAAAEMLGKTPRLFKSGVHDAAFYREFWRTIQADETWRGEVINARPDGSRYTVYQIVTPLRDADGQIAHYISILEDVSEKKATEERIRHMANFDALTDLPNRATLFDRLSQALALARRAGHAAALLFLDLDRFKEVNDSLGHEAGDILLKKVGERLLGQVRETDLVARFGGDEFAVVLPRVANVDDALRVAEKIIAAVASPLDLKSNEVSIGISIGIALFPEHGDSAEQLLNAADKAMYRAKHAGRSCVKIYAPSSA